MIRSAVTGWPAASSGTNDSAHVVPLFVETAYFVVFEAPRSDKSLDASSALAWMA